MTKTNSESHKLNSKKFMSKNPFEEIDEYLEQSEEASKISPEKKDQVIGSYNATNFIFKGAESIVKIFSTMFEGLLSFFEPKSK